MSIPSLGKISLLFITLLHQQPLPVGIGEFLAPGISIRQHVGHLDQAHETGVERIQDSPVKAVCRRHEKERSVHDGPGRETVRIYC